MPASIYCAIAAVILLFLSVVGHPAGAVHPAAGARRHAMAVAPPARPAAETLPRTHAAPLTASAAAPRLADPREPRPAGNPTAGGPARTRSARPAPRSGV